MYSQKHKGSLEEPRILTSIGPRVVPRLHVVITEQTVHLIADSLPRHLKDEAR